MHVLKVRNVHEALPRAMTYLTLYGNKQSSRNGDVYVAPGPVTTLYERPLERVGFWPERDFNVAFCLYEALWMLGGRNDLKSLTAYVKRFADYSDNNHTLHGAYGYRWRCAFGMDQLQAIAQRLRRDPNDRRCVLQMWDARLDLDKPSKDIPCNIAVTFQVQGGVTLNMVVFNRSNDIVFGAYFANAFHFSMLLEYMALLAGFNVGTYTQVSVNWHAYCDVFEQYRGVSLERNLYVHGTVLPLMMPGKFGRDDSVISRLLAGSRFLSAGSPWIRICSAVLTAHEMLREPYRFNDALGVLHVADPGIKYDLTRAMVDWVERRQKKADKKLAHSFIADKYHPVNCWQCGKARTEHHL